MSRTKQPVLTPHEQKLLLDEIDKQHKNVAPAIHLMAECGFRLNEARLCAWGWIHDLDTEHARVTIPDDKTKTHWSRTVPLPEKTRLVLLDLRRWFPHAQPLTYPENWTLTMTRRGLPPSKRYIQHVIRFAALKSIGREIRCHTLRHTFATQLLTVSSIRVVQEALGHRSIRSTQIYTHPGLTDIRNAMNAAATEPGETP